MGHCFGGSLGVGFHSQHLFGGCSLLTPYKREPVGPSDLIAVQNGPKVEMLEHYGVVCNTSSTRHGWDGQFPAGYDPEHTLAGANGLHGYEAQRKTSAADSSRTPQLCGKLS